MPADGEPPSAPAAWNPRPGLAHLPHRPFHDPDQLLQALRAMAPLRHLEPLTPAAACASSIASLALNELRLLSYVSSALRLGFEASPRLQLALTFNGERHAVTPHGEGTSLAGAGLLLPAGPVEITATRNSSVVLLLEPRVIVAAAAAMAGGHDRLKPLRHRLGGFAPLVIAGPTARRLQALLIELDRCLAETPALPALLGFDDLIHRQVALLLLPELLEPHADDEQRLRERQGISGFEALLDYIQAHLDQPLRLSELEARSHYSRRALQYAFRARLDCTPKQWIRRQRLNLAMERLRQGEGHTSIRQLAHACGFPDPGNFSRAFQEQFGLMPSQVRRRAL